MANFDVKIGVWVVFAVGGVSTHAHSASEVSVATQGARQRLSCARTRRECPHDASGSLDDALPRLLVLWQPSAPFRMYRVSLVNQTGSGLSDLENRLIFHRKVEFGDQEACYGLYNAQG